MAKAVFVSGTYDTIYHTPSTAIAAGDVVVIGRRPYVAHHDIAANVMGSLASGGGVYDLEKDGTSGPAFTDGEEVYWIDADDLATDVAEDNSHFGAAVGAAGASVAVVRAIHQPNGILVNLS